MFSTQALIKGENHCDFVVFVAVSVVRVIGADYPGSQWPSLSITYDKLWRSMWNCLSL